MSLFRKPKKIQRRVFTAADNEEDNGMDVDEDFDVPPPSIIKKEKSKQDSKKNAANKLEASSDGKTTKTKALLSFADDEDDAEIFQVRKSSHSKKMMRMLDKERRKKKKVERDGDDVSDVVSSEREVGSNGRSFNIGSSTSDSKNSNKVYSTAKTTATSGSQNATANAKENQCKSKKTDSIQTEIRTDDFVLVVKKSESELILNGRAAICAGRNDISDDDDTENGRRNDSDREVSHRFSKPEQLKQMLESGSIPDAAMIHAARKRRQKAREQGDFIPVEEPKEVPKKGSRLTHEDAECENSEEDEERMDMNAITGIKEREERREQFYAVENDYSEEDSDHETNDWENQQIRKGVTGAQLVSVQHESVLSRFMIKSNMSAVDYVQQPQSTSTLLEQAYAKCALEKPHELLTTAKMKKDKAKPVSLRSSQEIHDALSTRLSKLKEINSKHTAEVARITNDLKLVQMEELDCNHNAPAAAAKYRFYQEVKCYVSDLVECLNEKNPLISDLEKRTLQTLAKHQNYLIERRRQDVRDQAKEAAEATKTNPKPNRANDTEQQIRRAAEREGRRTRRRYEREKNEQSAIHLDGMSSDEETSDRLQEQYDSSIAQIKKEAAVVFEDVNDEFCKVDLILMKFFAWRKTDMEAYKDAFVSLCLPKILGPLVRLELLTCSLLFTEDYKDFEKWNWYTGSMIYAWSENETVEALKLDPDVDLVPTIIEKIILPKVTEIIKQCWDPLSTTQTLRLIGFINRLGREYPLKETSKSLQHLFNAILSKMKLALENDVFIPIFPKQVTEAKSSFFQRQFCSGLKLFHNFLSWQGIIADKPLRDLAISSLLNRYLLMAMRVCTANDAISKAYIVVNTLPTAWLHPESETLQNLQLFTMFIRHTLDKCDANNPLFMQSCEKAKQILQRLHSF